MSHNIGFQIGLELTKVLPVRESVENVGAKLLALARNLRKSGSDLVVEEDLAEMLGRAQLTPQFEKRFKEVVTEQGSKAIPGVSDVYLAQGAGPTVVNAVRDRRYLSAVAQLYVMCLD